MTKDLAARRLSAAIGRHVTADDVVFVGGDGGAETIQLADGSVYGLGPGNSVYKAGMPGAWYRHGKLWDRDA